MTEKMTQEGHEISDKEMQFLRCSYESLAQNAEKYCNMKDRVPAEKMSDYAKSRLDVSHKVLDFAKRTCNIVKSQSELELNELNEKQADMMKDINTISKTSELFKNNQVPSPENAMKAIQDISNIAPKFYGDKNDTALLKLAGNNMEKLMQAAGDKLQGPQKDAANKVVERCKAAQPQPQKAASANQMKI